MPIPAMISMPYWNANTIPSWAARSRWPRSWLLKSSPSIRAPMLRLPSTRSAPFPNGSTLSPQPPTGAAAASRFISA